MNRLTNFYLFIFFILSNCICLLSCKIQSNHNKKIFSYNESSGLATLDPAFAKNKQVMWAVHQVYSTLVEIDSTLKIAPSIATSWDISDDKTVFTFHLRNDIFFHDDAAFIEGKGRKLIASDVVYSFNRLLDASVASPGAWIFNDRVDSLEPFKAINDSTFQLKLIRPFHSVLGILSMQYCSIVPKEAVDKYSPEFRRHPVGTGPFAFVAWEEGQMLLLKKNPHYFEKDTNGISLPYLDGIKVSFNDSKATEFLEFRQKKIDFIDDIDPSFKDEVLTKTGNLKKTWKNEINLNKKPYLNIEYFGFLLDSSNGLVKNSPLQNKKIRQAINYALDRKKLIFYLRNSIGIPAENGFVPMGLPSFDTTVKGYTYNPALAKLLLKEAGYSIDKFPTPILLTTIPIYADIASFVANELKQIGLNVQVDIIQKSLLLQQTSKSGVAFFRGSWIADYPDAENYLSVFYGKNPAPPNYTRYKNAAYDLLYESAMAESNDSIRFRMYQKMDQIIMNDAVVVPLWYDMAIHFVQKNIQNFSPNSLNLLELRRAKKN